MSNESNNAFLFPSVICAYITLVALVGALIMFVLAHYPNQSKWCRCMETEQGNENENESNNANNTNNNNNSNNNSNNNNNNNGNNNNNSNKEKNVNNKNKEKKADGIQSTPQNSQEVLNAQTRAIANDGHNLSSHSMIAVATSPMSKSGLGAPFGVNGRGRSNSSSRMSTSFLGSNSKRNIRTHHGNNTSQKILIGMPL
ncbi:hypothetical protein RFI_31678, partial [Reticulomyxa filosa]